MFIDFESCVNFGDVYVCILRVAYGLSWMFLWLFLGWVDAYDLTVLCEVL